MIILESSVIFAALILRIPQATAEICSLAKRSPTIDDVFQHRNIVPNALDPNFICKTPANNRITIQVRRGMHDPGLLDDCENRPRPELGKTTKIYGYAEVGEDPTWPGETFEVKRAVQCKVTWENELESGHPHVTTGADNTRVPNDEGSFTNYGDFSDIPVVDTSLHWAHSLPGIQDVCDPDTKPAGECIEDLGVPVATHLHGGHTSAENDGNPEFFYNHDFSVVGPQCETNEHSCNNNLEATSIWCHDHALGIARLNVYAGLAGFYFIRDNQGVDTGKSPNKCNLPTHPYEVALAIQDRMFKNNGELLYPAFPGDPEFEGFIDVEGADTSSFPACAEPATSNCGPTALAEFFGDHMVVNGVVWPRLEVEPCQYRLRLLNGCDSRFLVLEFVVVNAVQKDLTGGEPLPFAVIGSDQGIKTKKTGPIDDTQEVLVIGPGERFDVIIDFSGVEFGKRVIMKNSGGDTPCGGGIPDQPDKLYDYTDRIMTFDIPEGASCNSINNFSIKKFNKSLKKIGHKPVLGRVSRIRKVGLFEGRDEYNRLQPLVGPVEEATDFAGNSINWPDDCADGPYCLAGLTGPVEGTVGWHTTPATENPKQNAVELWEVWNLSADAHPIHLHLVDFEVVGRYDIIFNDGTDEMEPSEPIDPIVDAVSGTGVYVEVQGLVQHTGEVAETGGRKAVFDCPPGQCHEGRADSPYNDIGHPKDVFIANPGQVTKIKARFTKTGRYVWHCHILSHEDHEMMRVLHVGRQTATERHLRGDAEAQA